MKTYLGDGVYVDVENNMIKLTTENGVEITNMIVLESEVWTALLAWVARLRDHGL